MEQYGDNLKHVLEWEPSDLNTIADLDESLEEDSPELRYENCDHESLTIMIKNLSDSLDHRLMSLSLVENLEASEKKKELVERMEKSVRKIKIDLGHMRTELHRRPAVNVPTLNAYAYPRIVLEYT